MQRTFHQYLIRSSVRRGSCARIVYLRQVGCGHVDWSEDPLKAMFCPSFPEAERIRGSLRKAGVTDVEVVEFGGEQVLPEPVLDRAAWSGCSGPKGAVFRSLKPQGLAAPGGRKYLPCEGCEVVCLVQKDDQGVVCPTCKRST